MHVFNLKFSKRKEDIQKKPKDEEKENYFKENQANQKKKYIEE